MKRDTDSPERHLRWRQAAIFTTLIGLVALVGLFAYGMWRGDLATVLNAPFKDKPAEEEEVLAVPCPVAPAEVHTPTTAVPVKVMNGSGQSGAAAATASALAALGFPDPSSGNAARYDGVAKLVAGPVGVNGAYTLLQYLPQGAVLVLDSRDDASVDLILGAEFTDIREAQDVTYSADTPIQPLDGCRQVAELLDDSPKEEASESPSPQAATVRARR
jgi:hypothetical protein